MLTNNYKTYKIVGFLQEQFEIGEGVFSGETFLDNLEDNKEYNVFFTVINNKNKTKLVNEKFDNLNLDRNFNYINVNNDLLALIGESEYTGINTVVKVVVVFVLLIIILATIFLIYNAINISVTERMTQFAILRSIGATPKQISNIVIKEGLAMCLLSIPFGIVFGFLGVWTTVKIMNIKITNLLGTGQLIIRFHLSVILFSLILGMTTIFMATYGPAKKAGKVLPISFIKGNTENEKIKIPLVLLSVRVVSYGFTISNKIYWQPFVIGFLINLFVVLIASLIPLNKLKKMNLVETIRHVE